MIDNKTIRKVIMLNKMLPSGSPTYENREASGAVANFTTNVVMPFVKCECTIDATESGMSVLNVEQRGVSSFDEQTELGTLDINTGEETPSTTQLRTKNYVSVKNGASYYLKSSRTMWVLFYDRQKNVISDDLPSGGSQAGNSRSFINTTIAIPSNCFYIRWYWVSGYGTSYLDDTSLNYPSTDTNYHAYTGTTTSVSLDETAYGGSVDVIAGSGRIIDEHGDLVYTLFEPVSISALEGVNNVWCDTGNIEVTYKYKTGEGGSSTKKYLPIFYDLYGEEKYHDHS